MARKNNKLQWCWSIRRYTFLSSLTAPTGSLFEQNTDGRLFRRYVVPHSTGIEMPDKGNER
jgi:hypothetical protein